MGIVPPRPVAVEGVQHLKTRGQLLADLGQAMPGRVDFQFFEALQENILGNGVEKQEGREKGGGENGQGLFSDGAKHHQTAQQGLW